MVSLIDLLASLAKIGVNLTDTQRKTLEWRLSSEGKKYYSDQENNEFYKAVESGNTDVIDITRKEKQKKIKDLKKQLGLVSIFIMLFISGCSLFSSRPSIPSERIRLDPDALKANEKSYTIEDVEVYTSNKKEKVKFEGIWYIVNKDFIKEHNENQDDLISSFEQQIELKKQVQLYKIISISSCIISFVFIIAFFILIRKKSQRRKK